MTTSMATSTPLTDELAGTHPALSFVRTTRVRAARLVDASLESLDGGATTELVAGITALENQLAELKARAVARAQALDLPRDSGTRSPAVWLARTINVPAAEARRTAKLAAGLRGRESLRRAACLGDVGPAQALAIDAALRDFDQARIDTTAVEHDLVAQAPASDAQALLDAGRRALDAADPAGVDGRQAATKESTAARARRSTRLAMYDDGGRTIGRFNLPADKGRQLREALESLIGPGRVADDDEPRPSDPEHLGRAFVALLEGALKGRRVGELVDSSRRLRPRRRRADRTHAAA